MARLFGQLCSAALDNRKGKQGCQVFSSARQWSGLKTTKFLKNKNTYRAICYAHAFVIVKTSDNYSDKHWELGTYWHGQNISIFPWTKYRFSRDCQLPQFVLFDLIFVFNLASPTSSNVDNVEEETKLLHSEIWAILFRGGYMTGKLQRSLSGHYVSAIKI